MTFHVILYTCSLYIAKCEIGVASDQRISRVFQRCRAQSCIRLQMLPSKGLPSGGTIYFKPQHVQCLAQPIDLSGRA